MNKDLSTRIGWEEIRAVQNDNVYFLNENLANNWGASTVDLINTLSEITQSQEQAFYSFDSVTLDGEGIEDGDWLVARNGDVIVGVSAWEGSGTEVVVMGQESWPEGWESPVDTDGMMLAGQTPQFYVYDASTNLESIAQYEAADGTVQDFSDKIQSIEKNQIISEKIESGKIIKGSSGSKSLAKTPVADGTFKMLFLGKV